LICKFLGIKDYADVLAAMQAFTKDRNISTTDELWFLEHPAVFTEGLASKKEHILADINIVKSDRGGQITYHAPGQLIVYVLLNLAKKSLNLRELIFILSQAVIELLASYNINAHTIDNAPGVYIDNNKICCIGLKITKGCTYHGLSLNVDMDLQPFRKINPCGYVGLKMTKISEFVDNITVSIIAQKLSKILINKLK